MTNRERIYRLGAVLLTLSAALGAVWLMRRGARLAVDGLGLVGEADSSESLPDRRPAPRTYDLLQLVPESLEFNIAGLQLHSIGTTLDRPIDLAVRQDEQLALAQGWELLEMPLVYSFSQDLRGEHLYRTPSGEVKRRTYYEIAGDRTRREELTIPIDSCPKLRGDESFEALAGSRAAELRARLPEVLGQTIVGDVFQTRLIRRGNGTAFHVSAVDGFDELTERARIFAAFTRAGWVNERKGELVFRRANLMAFAKPLARDDGAGTLSVYRFSDDEALEEAPVDDDLKKEKQKNEQQ